MHSEVNEKERKKDFVLEEWKVVRDQMHILLKAIWQLEMATIGGVAAYYAWLFSINGPETDNQWLAGGTVLLPFFFIVGIIFRLKIEYSIIMRLGQYSAKAELFFYKGELFSDLQGWQHFIDCNSPDSIPRREVWKRYSHTFYFFSGAAVLTLIVALLKTGYFQLFLSKVLIAFYC
ncbi:hypothetical protein [Hoeflea marina]|uniref:hypothetical protein n=1 Tax=Hoeflea marina TaxID=274592 RepID=UPI0011B4CC5A|nr:hypothetical protein [Hoeflea marina]